jgi:hypothetical protein
MFAKSALQKVANFGEAEPDPLHACPGPGNGAGPLLEIRFTTLVEIVNSID